jgi:hypothetical protein
LCLLAAKRRVLSDFMGRFSRCGKKLFAHEKHEGTEMFLLALHSVQPIVGKSEYIAHVELL